MSWVWPCLEVPQRLLNLIGQNEGASLWATGLEVADATSVIARAGSEPASGRS
jgi:hypothetical protein